MLNVRTRFALILIGLLAAPAAAAQAPAPAATAAQRASFERDLLRGNGGATFAAIKAGFPQDYQAMLADMTRQALAARGDRAALARIGFQAMRGFYASKLRDILNAPSPALIAFNARELAFVNRLSGQDKALCHMYVMTGFSPGTSVPAAAQPDMREVGLAMVAAAKAGSGRPTDPQRGKLSPADAAAWSAAITALDPSEAMRKYLSGEQTQVSDPTTGCRMGTAVYQAIAGLPAEQAARITAYLIGSSLAAQRGR